MYESPELVLSVNNTVTERRPIVWRWIFTKRIKVAHFYDCTNIEGDVVNEYLRLCGCSIQFVTVYIHEDLQLAMYCRNIKSLTFSTLFGRGSCTDILLSNPGLEELRLVKLSDHILGIALPKLKVFSSYLSFDVSDSFPPFLKSAVCLLKLELTGGSFPPHLLAHCLYNCPHLKSLGLINCRLDDVELESIPIYGASIANLNLSNNQGITDDGVLTIVSQLKLLRTLCLECCTRLTNLSARYIAEHCTESLEVLHIGHYSHSQEKLTHASIYR